MAYMFGFLRGATAQHHRHCSDADGSERPSEGRPVLPVAGSWCQGDADVKARTSHERPSRRYFFQASYSDAARRQAKPATTRGVSTVPHRQALWSSRESCPSEYTGQNDDMREASRPIPWFEKISSISSISSIPSSSASPSRQLHNHHLHREHRQRQHRQQRLFDFYSSNVL